MMNRSLHFGGLVTIAVLLVLLATAGLAQQSRDSAAATGSALFRQMQATGKPALVIAGNDGCIYCREMAAELSSNAALQPYVRQMFVLKVTTESNEWPLLRQEFNFQENGIPAVFFVRADGELLYGDAGKPQDMEAFLTKLVGQAGVILDAQSLSVMRRDTRQLDRALKRDDWSRIAELVGEHGRTGSYAAAAIAFDSAATELTEQATEEVAAAETQLEDAATRVEGAIALVAASKLYAGYEPALRHVKAAIEQAGLDVQTTQLFEDAERLAEAAALEAKRRKPAAMELYQQVIAGRPDSAAATYAAERMKAIESRRR